jgi:hypothetical protein
MEEEGEFTCVAQGRAEPEVYSEPVEQKHGSRGCDEHLLSIIPLTAPYPLII